MEDQLEQAVNIAIQGTGEANIKQQAIDFCSQIRSSQDGWQICLGIFTGKTRRSDASRFFSLQVIDSALANLNLDQLQYVRNNLYSYAQNLIASCTTESQPPDPPYMRNKFAQTLAFLFVLLYSNAWPTYFDDFLVLMSSDGEETASSAVAVDLYLRILRVIHEEIGDNLIVRSSELTKRNNALKDHIRERDMAKLSSSWLKILQLYPSSSSRIPKSYDKLQSEIIESCLKVIGEWVSWIDISLIVLQPSYLNAIFNLLADQNQQLYACDTLSEIVSKKMKPGDKLDLISLLNLTEILSRLPTGSSDIDFDERVAKLSNIVGLELIQVMDGTMSAATGTQQNQSAFESRAESLMNQLFPTILQFLSNEYDDTSSQVFPCISEYLTYVRKQVKREKDQINPNTLAKNPRGQIINLPPDSSFISPTRSSILQSVLAKLISKMKYDESTDWTGGEDDSEGEFLDIRAKLKLLQDLIASIDMDLYIDGISSVVNQSLSVTLDSSWRDVELGLYELSVFKVVTSKGFETRGSRVLLDLFTNMISSNVVSTINHPSIQLLYMELVNRHSAFFSSSQPQLLTKALQVFVSPLGIHNANRRVRVRAWYLFYRFVKSVKGIVGDMSEDIISSTLQLLTIRVDMASLIDEDGVNASNSGVHNLAEAALKDSLFESQVYLFELCGLLIPSVKSDNRLRITQGLLQPIYNDIERCLSIRQQQSSTKLDSELALQVHHDLMALGTVARGLDEATTNITLTASGSGEQNSSLEPQIVQELKNAAQVTLVALDNFSKIEIIRNAARFSFARLIPVLGIQILGEVSQLISLLLNESKADELVDFLGFLGQLVHRFRAELGVFEMFNSLMSPLIQKVFVILEQCNSEATEGSTDAVILKQDLSRGYLTFLFNVLNNGMSAIFISDVNSGIFQNVMQSILHYAGNVQDPQTAKLAIVTLSKMLAVWGSGRVQADSSSSSPAVGEVFGKDMEVPGFEEFIFGHISRVCWEIPGKPGFNVKDAQMRLILNEVAGLQKSIYLVKGDRFTKYLEGQYFVMIGLPNEFAQEYLMQLAALDQKEFRKFYIVSILRIPDLGLTNKGIFNEII